MSRKSSAAAPAAGTAAELFRYEIRRDGRQLVLLRGVRSEGGAVVETAVFPATEPPTTEPVLRPYEFTSAAHATRFAEETVLALEYLGCSVS